MDAFQTSLLDIFRKDFANPAEAGGDAFFGKVFGLIQ